MRLFPNWMKVIDKHQKNCGRDQSLSQAAKLIWKTKLFWGARVEQGIMASFQSNANRVSDQSKKMCASSFTKVQDISDISVNSLVLVECFTNIAPKYLVR